MPTHKINSEETLDRSKSTEYNEYSRESGYKGSINVVGGAGRDKFEGGSGDDWFKDSGGGSEAHGNGGRDYLEGGNGVNVLYGGWGNDILVGNQDDATDDRLYGGAHNDFLVAGRLKASNRVDDSTGARTDLTRGNGPTNNGSPKGNVLRGGHGGDFFILHPDSYVYIEDWRPLQDVIYVVGIRDGAELTIVHHPDGHYGNKHFRVMLGNTVLAEVNYDSDFDPNDAVAVAAAIAAIKEGTHTASGDWINGDHQGNNIQGTEHDDHIYGHGGEDTLEGGAGEDALVGGHGNDILRGGAGPDRLYGNQGNDSLYGNVGMDTLNGGSGNDLLYGGRGDDQLYGDDGHDRLDGGPGRDVLYGGPGRDIFVISEGRADGAADLIMDFNVDEDHIRLPFSVTWDDVRFIRSADTSGPTTHLVKGTGESQETLARFDGFENYTTEQLQKLKLEASFIWDFDPNKDRPALAGKTLNGTNKKDLLIGDTGDDTIRHYQGPGRGGRTPWPLR